MKLSIIIPVHNNWNFTKSCLTDLAKLQIENEVFVIDNASRDDTVYLNPSEDRDLLCDDRPANLKYVRNNENLGFAKACNEGYVRSSGEFVLFLNNDIRVQQNHEAWVKLLIDAAEDGSLVGPTGGLLDANLNFVKETDKLEKGNFYMSGWNLLARRETFDSLIINNYSGPFSEEFGLAYFEDTDLGMRAKRQGINMKIVPVPVIHFGKMTSRKLNTADLYLSAKTKFKNKWIKHI
jgi:GT2 family glycosyltransferase